MRGNLSEPKIYMAEESMIIAEAAGSQSIPDRSEMARRERIAQSRERKPLGMKSPLSFGNRPGFHRHVINDVNNRINDALEAGYTPVMDNSKTQTDGDAGRASQMANAVKRQVGNGVTGYLMEIPQEWYDEDQKKKQKQNDNIDKSIVDVSRVGGRDSADGAIGAIPGTQGIAVERY